MLRVMYFSFFVVPMLIAIVGVALFSGAYWLIAGEPTALELIHDVQHSYTNKRWQSAYHLVTMFDGPNAVPITPEIQAALLEAFEESTEDDESAVRQYLALAMGCTGEAAFVTPLIEALENDPLSNKPFIVRALGRLGNPAGIESVMACLDSDNVSLRLESAIALGAMGNRHAIPALKRRLNDPEANVQWDVAIALAKLGDIGGSGVLLQLLDRNYIAKFDEVDENETQRILLVAIQVGASLRLPELNESIGQLAQSDPNMDVRTMAQRALRQHAAMLLHPVQGGAS